MATYATLLGAMRAVQQTVFEEESSSIFGEVKNNSHKHTHAHIEHVRGVTAYWQRKGQVFENKNLLVVLLVLSVHCN